MVTEEVKRVYAFGKDAQGNNVTEGNTNMKAQLGGKGGGRPDSAMGGVADLSKAEEVLSGVPALLEGMVK